MSLADELLRPSVIYTPAILGLVRAGIGVHAVAHITGGGLPGNVPRVLPAALDAVIERGSWAVPPIFAEIQRSGAVTDEEMAQVFNLGVGMVVAVAPGEVAAATEVVAAAGHQAGLIGHLTAGTGDCLLV